MKSNTGVQAHADRLLADIAGLEGITSLTLIGEPPMLRPEVVGEEEVVDLDVVVVAEKVDGHLLDSLGRILEDRRNDEGETAVSGGLISGVYHERDDRKRNTFDQVMLYEGTPMGKDLILSDISWTQWPAFHGRDLAEIYLGRSPSNIQRHPLRVTKEMLVDRHDGLKYTRDLCNRNMTNHGVWKITLRGAEKVRVERRTQDERERMELYLYTILRGASNYTRYLMGDITWGIDLGMCRKFAGITSERDTPFSRLPEEAFRDKRALRTGRLAFPIGFVEGYQAKAIAFIDYLIRKTDRII